MLTIWSEKQGRYCDGLSRRGFLKAGTLGLGSLTLSNLLRLKAQGAVQSGAGRKSVIMVYLFGGPSHIDMYDLKPNAPVEYRGEFKPIQTNVPGMEISELMPLQAKIADKLAIVRNMEFTQKPIGAHSPVYLYGAQLADAKTVTFPAIPAVVGEGKPATTSVLAAAGFTMMFDWLPVIELLEVSVAVMDCEPAVLSVPVKV